MADKKFFWIVWDLNCPITKHRKYNFAKYLAEHEKHLIPKFIKYIEDYAEFRAEELKNKYKFKILREVKIRSPKKNT